jgi:ABC-type arginine transport system ATPase subunit
LIEEASMKRRAKNSDDPLYRYLHEMTDEQLVAALHELADRIEGQALIASKKSANKRLAAKILYALEARDIEDGEQQ